MKHLWTTQLFRVVKLTSKVLTNFFSSIPMVEGQVWEHFIAFGNSNKSAFIVISSKDSVAKLIMQTGLIKNLWKVKQFAKTLQKTFLSAYPFQLLFFLNVLQLLFLSRCRFSSLSFDSLLSTWTLMSSQKFESGCLCGTQSMIKE